MAAPRNSRSISQMFDGAGGNLQQWLVAKPKAFYEALTYKLQHLPQTNFDLGNHFAAQGKLQDAAFRFRVALYLQPNFVRAQYNLGCCYLRLNKRPQARQAFIQTLKLVPNHEEALFMLSAVDPASVAPSQRPSHMPDGLVQDFFNGMAAQYDAIELNNQYLGAKACADALKSFIGNRTNLRIVDLGCGTGIAVRGLRAVAAEITGIDFSPAMAATARAVTIGDRALFDTVLEEDIAKLADSTAPLGEADVAICCNTVQFLGDLQPLLRTLGARMNPNALILLTIEPFSAPSGYAVNIDTGRFGHHPDYVKKIASSAGFVLKNDARMHLYPSIFAHLFIFAKETE